MMELKQSNQKLMEVDPQSERTKKGSWTKTKNGHTQTKMKLCEMKLKL